MHAPETSAPSGSGTTRATRSHSSRPTTCEYFSQTLLLSGTPFTAVLHRIRNGFRSSYGRIAYEMRTTLIVAGAVWFLLAWEMMLALALAARLQMPGVPTRPADGWTAEPIATAGPDPVIPSRAG